jgi:hypothetical protein
MINSRWALPVLLLISSCASELEHFNTSLPNLCLRSDGSISTSYVVERNGMAELMFDGNIIASGDDWIVNWADFPLIVEYAPGNLAASYLIETDRASFAYDIELILSSDDGKTWSAPVSPHTDSTLTEHGFVAMAGVGEDLMVIWLDGRNYAEGKDIMELRGALLDSSGEILEQYLIDDNVCSCCGTDMIRFGDELLLVYRDRTPEEVRDISLVHFDFASGTWGETEAINNDNWVIAGCPVNGPAIDVLGDEVFVSWYTVLDGEPTVFVTLGDGVEFATPQKVNTEYTLGRTDIAALGDGRSAISWLEGEGDEVYLKVRDLLGGSLGNPRTVTKMNGSRASGFPKMKVQDEELVLVNTSIFEGNKSRVETHRISH